MGEKLAQGDGENFKFPDPKAEKEIYKSYDERMKESKQEDAKKVIDKFWQLDREKQMVILKKVFDERLLQLNASQYDQMNTRHDNTGSYERNAPGFGEDLTHAIDYFKYHQKELSEKYKEIQQEI